VVNLLSPELRFAAPILVVAEGARCNDGRSFFSSDVFWQGKDAGIARTCAA